MSDQTVQKPTTVGASLIECHLRNDSRIVVVSTEPIMRDPSNPSNNKIPMLFAVGSRIIIAPNSCTYDLEQLAMPLRDLSKAFSPESFTPPDFNKYTMKFTAGKLVFRENLGTVITSETSITKIVANDPILTAQVKLLSGNQPEGTLIRRDPSIQTERSLDGETIIYLYYDKKVASKAARLFPYTPDKVMLSAKRLSAALRGRRELVSAGQ